MRIAGTVGAAFLVVGLSVGVVLTSAADIGWDGDEDGDNLGAFGQAMFGPGQGPPAGSNLVSFHKADRDDDSDVDQTDLAPFRIAFAGWSY